jgi:hypothetical protein
MGYGFCKNVMFPTQETRFSRHKTRRNVEQKVRAADIPVMLYIRRIYWPVAAYATWYLESGFQRIFPERMTMGPGIYGEAWTLLPEATICFIEKS